MKPTIKSELDERGQIIWHCYGTIVPGCFEQDRHLRWSFRCWQDAMQHVSAFIHLRNRLHQAGFTHLWRNRNKLPQKIYGRQGFGTPNLQKMA